MDQYGVDSAESFPFPTLLRIPKKLEEKFEVNYIIHYFLSTFKKSFDLSKIIKHN